MTDFMPLAQTCVSVHAKCQPPFLDLMTSATCHCAQTARAPPTAAVAETDLVDGGSFGRLWQSGADDDLTSRRLTDVRLEDVAKVQFFNLLGLDAGLCESGFDGRNSELNRTSFREAAL